MNAQIAALQQSDYTWTVTVTEGDLETVHIGASLQVVPYTVPVTTPPTTPPPTTTPSGFLYKLALEAFTPTWNSTAPAVGVPWTCQHSGATVERITDYTTLPIGPSEGIQGAVIVYSRYTPESSDGSLLLIHADATQGSVFSWVQKTADNSIVRENKGLNGDYIGEKNELRWDYTGSNPTTFYYVDGMQFCSQDASTGVSTLVHDFSTDFPNSQTIFTDVEGDSSLDSRYWCWMAAHYDQTIGYDVVDDIFVYDKQANAIVGKYTAHNTLPPAANGASKPNMVDMCPDGSGCVIDWGVNQGTAPDQNGAHFYPTDFSTSLRVGNGQEHSGWAMNSAGKWGFVSQDNSTDNILWVDVHGSGYGTPDGTNVIAINSMANFGYKEMGDWHFGKLNVPGWMMLITGMQGYAQPGDNQILYFPVQTNATPLVVASTYNYPTGTYYTQCFGASSLDGSRVYFGGNYNKLVKLEDVFKVTIPSDWRAHA